MEKLNRILVIPDVHGRDFWEEGVNTFTDGVDKIIFTGDYHDPYDNEKISTSASIENFEKILTFYEANKDKTVMLIGNHDLHYMFNIGSYTSRFDHGNYNRLHEMFTEYKDELKIAYEAEIGDKKYLFSHAGFMKAWYENYKDVIGKPTVDCLNDLLNKPQGLGVLCAVSRYRSYLGDKAGSIVWSDVRERFDKDDAQMDGWYQVFGHTQLKQPIIMDNWACIDSRKLFIIDSEGLKEL